MLGIILGKVQIFSLLLLLIFLFLVVFYFYPSKRMGLFFIIIFLLLGYGMSNVEINQTSKLSSFDEQNIKLNAYVMQPPVEKENKTEMILKVNEAYVQEKSYIIEEKVLANVYKNENTSNIDIKAGDYLNLQGKVRIPDGIRNPGGFDYSLYLNTQKIYATINISSGTIEKLGYDSPGIIKNFIYGLKGYVSQIIEQNLVPDHANLLKGILFGDKELSSDIRDNFVHSGIAHVLAVSGLHVGFLITFVTYTTNLFSIGRKGSLCILTFFLIVYILLTGASPSVIRASIMAFIFLLSKMINKKYDGISALSLAGLLVLLQNPLILYTASFQLSFTAALSIILFYPVISGYLQKIKYIPKSVGSLLSVTLVAQIGTLPISLYHFNQISLISIITNLFIVPSLGILLLVSVIAILSWMIIPFLGEFLFFLSGLLFQWIIYIAFIFSSFKFSYIFMPPFKGQNILLYGIVCLSLAGYIPLRIKRIKIFITTILILLLSFSGIQYFLPQPLKITYLDVGQGDSALIETPSGRTIFIDGGGYPSFQENTREISEDVLLPAIYSKGIRTIDLAIVSHPHDDHIKGIKELIGKIPIKAIGIYDIKNDIMVDMLALAKKNKIPINYLTSGQTIKLDKGIIMEILSPEGVVPPGNGQNEVNNYSLVAKINFDEISFLFTGDIEKEMEERLVAQGVDVDAMVLKVAHHGSNTSSTEDFINKVNPQVCIISVGKNNNFGHPDPEIIKRLKEYTPYIYRTDERGAVEVISNGNGLKIKPYLNKKYLESE
ncbi:DNA internalization-related competence protein ComEC/Rec2 [Irregularibacter muris]|uniref:DNA internalization-related competence protein ComEC/Rec2 n=1 Tax=Irregularibacter muris TaxID=1796619 RepID=A0AAE3HD95_9FIRM|nr:DNA internalization-related competence protein ComEC/Rec2 [Irregularibacter muris]MCR1897836.1 DNA internalization-related competence protein ComEC/Rec2 [Irregularibacter muris]